MFGTPQSCGRAHVRWENGSQAAPRCRPHHTHSRLSVEMPSDTPEVNLVKKT